MTWGVALRFCFLQESAELDFQRKQGNAGSKATAPGDAPGGAPGHTSGDAPGDAPGGPPRDAGAPVTTPPQQHVA